MMKKILENLTKYVLYATVFLIPLFFLPFSNDPYEFNKLFLLFALVSVGVVGWLGRLILVERAVVFKKTPFDIWVLLFLAGVLLTTLFSQDWRNSIFGLYGRFSNSFIELVLWVGFYFLITQSLNAKEAKQMLNVFLYSSFFVVASFFLSYFGLLAHISFRQLLFTSTLGIAPEALAVFAATSMILLLSQWVFWPSRDPFMVVFHIVLFGLDLLALLLINFAPVWAALALIFAGFVVSTLFLRLLSGKDINRLALPLFIAFISIVFLVFPSLFKFGSVPQEILLDQKTSWDVSLSAFQKFPLGGIGLGNWREAFFLFKPLSFNADPFWSYAFDTPRSYISYLLATTGVLGLLPFILLMAIIGLSFWHALRTKEERIKGFKVALIPLLPSLGGLVFLLFFYYQPVSLSLPFWLFLGIAANFISKERSFPEFRKELEITPEASLFLASSLLIGIFGLAILGYYAGKFYYADVLYQKSQGLQDSPERVTMLGNAVSYNPFYMEYQYALAQSASNYVLGEALKPQAQSSEFASKLGPYITLASGTLNNAAIITPKRSEAWESRGVLYRDLRILAPKNEDMMKLAVESFSTASSLNPTNPLYPIQVSRLYLDKGDLNQAKSFAEKARTVKSDHPLLKLADALIKEKDRKSADAIKTLEQALNDPQLPALFIQELSYNLGRMTFDAGNTKEAIDALTLVLRVNDKNVNALFLLGQAYERSGNKAKALEQYKKLETISPGNKEIEKLIKNLSGSASAQSQKIDTTQ